MFMVIQKRQGRPPTGQDPVVTVRLPPILIQQIDDWAAEHGVSRSEAIRGALEALVALGGLAPPDEPVAPAPRKPTEAAPTKPKVVVAPSERRVLVGFDMAGEPIYR
jgi:hypothetical protein